MSELCSAAFLWCSAAFFDMCLLLGRPNPREGNAARRPAPSQRGTLPPRLPLAALEGAEADAPRISVKLRITHSFDPFHSGRLAHGAAAACLAAEAFASRLRQLTDDRPIGFLGKSLKRDSPQIAL